MPKPALSQREDELVAIMLQGRGTLRATYAGVFGIPPPPEWTDRRIIHEILRKEFGKLPPEIGGAIR